MSLLFLLAYACSGFAGLVYEVTWTRQLTLYMGHTTAAASTVVAAFMLGLAGGAAIGGRFTTGLDPRAALYVYVALEAVVAVAAILLPFELRLLTPLLAWAYHDGAPGALFPAVRLLSCLLLMLVPALALGATFPMAARWFVDDPSRAGRRGGALYAVNTAGAAIGALVTGFTLIPAIGVSGSTRVGLVASAVAAGSVLLIARRPGRAHDRSRDQPARRSVRGGGKARGVKSDPPDLLARRSFSEGGKVEPAGEPVNALALAAVTLGISGFASLTYEIAWTRILALLIGPTTYAFAATLGVFIAGLAVGSAIGAWGAARTTRPVFWMSIGLLVAAVAAAWSGGLGGSAVPRYVARAVAAAPDAFAHGLTRHALTIAALTLPAAIALGAAFPLAFSMIGKADPNAVAARLGIVYAVNTIGAVSGSLLAGFFFIPTIGLEQTLRVVSVILVGGALLLVLGGRLTRREHTRALTAGAVAVTLLVLSPAWDRALVVSGAYRYAPYVPEHVDLESALKAGSLLYYRDGAAATVSVKQITGTLSLAIDGKVDASNGSDILTQKLIAHLPLLLHEQPRSVAIIGLGSGITLESALTHPIDSADVLEISPEVVEASQFFRAENRNALADPRTRLIVGDGRSHLWLSRRTYDVIVSEPSNPWIAGVASLFTREFFAAARQRLAPGGIICQWAHTYNMSDADLRSIVGTFISVFPNGTAWLIGQADVLLIASTEPLDARLGNISPGLGRPGVAEDLQRVSVRDPFTLLSLFAAGPAELARYSAGASLQTDDRTALEFSAPYQMHAEVGADNAAKLSSLLEPGDAPAIPAAAVRNGSAAEWRNRGAMMLRADMHAVAYEDFLRALSRHAADADAYDGLVKTASASGRADQALERLRALEVESFVSTAGGAAKPRTESPAAGKSPWTPTALTLMKTAQSKLLSASGQREAALAMAKTAVDITGATDAAHRAALEQVAALVAQGGDTERVEAAVAALQQAAPAAASTYYYAAVARFLRADYDDALTLANRGIAVDASYAALYDLIGAVQTKRGQPAAARDAFLKSIAASARDSTAYTNLGLLELAAGNKAVAANYFAEALWLEPSSEQAREGLARAKEP